MVRKNLHTAAHQHKDAEQIDEMVDPKPERKFQYLLIHPSHLVGTEKRFNGQSSSEPASTPIRQLTGAFYIAEVMGNDPLIHYTLTE